MVVYKPSKQMWTESKLCFMPVLNSKCNLFRSCWDLCYHRKKPMKCFCQLYMYQNLLWSKCENIYIYASSWRIQWIQWKLFLSKYRLFMQRLTLAETRNLHFTHYKSKQTTPNRRQTHKTKTTEKTIKTIRQRFGLNFTHVFILCMCMVYACMCVCLVHVHMHA